jgi:hypothetical protein
MFAKFKRTSLSSIILGLRRLPFRIVPVCAGSLGGFYEKELWMWS